MANPFTIEQFIKNSKNVHGDRYDYSLVEYKNAKTKVSIKCKKHGVFYQIPDTHSHGAGCDKCAHDFQSKAKNKKFAETYIQRAKAIHGDTYDYSETYYNKARLPVDIICRIHGKWSALACSHTKGCGCPKCFPDKIRKAQVQSIEDFIKRANIVHGDRYDYSLVIYKTAREYVDIICQQHGVFSKHPDTHVNAKSGCPRCLDRWSSQNKWLDSLGIPNDTKHRQVRLQIGDRYIIVDGFDEQISTVYEYWGTYYHGHPDYHKSDDISYMKISFGDLYEKTQKKIELIKQGGFSLVDVWEHDWLQGERETDNRVNQA